MYQPMVLQTKTILRSDIQVTGAPRGPRQRDRRRCLLDAWAHWSAYVYADYNLMKAVNEATQVTEKYEQIKRIKFNGNIKPE